MVHYIELQLCEYLRFGLIDSLEEQELGDLLAGPFRHLLVEAYC
jgi:hypothetical protein